MTNNNIYTDNLQELYRELILDHARAPHNFCKMSDATHSAQGINPLCGDKLNIYLNINNKNEIKKISFEGIGCAISIASASLLTDMMKEKNTNEALKFSDIFLSYLTGREQEENANKNIDIGKLIALGGVKKFPSRVKCATLSWHALKAAINQNDDLVSTE
tara:strand:+ start:410 stop:892 length:483 start_codon:yes stop_codon:yes gene_type:complete